MTGIKRGSLLAAIATSAALLAACGSSSKNSSATQPAAAAATTAAAAPASSPSSAAAAIKTASSSLGTILVTDKGLTVYGFTPDSAGKPTCAGDCADEWPAVTVGSATLPAGLDASVFSVVDGLNGTHQLKAGKWPLYTFVGDKAPGDTTGQDVDKFYVVSPTGKLIES